MTESRAKAAKAETFAVDRIEGTIVVLIGKRGRKVEVPSRELPAACRKEGAVLLVTRAPQGGYAWKDARRDSAEEARRDAESSERLARLKKRDPGGDIKL